MPRTYSRNDRGGAPAAPQRPANGDRRRGWLQLAGAAALAAFLWLLVLPYLGSLRPVRQWIDRNQQRRIDPSAMFYSELEIVAPLVADLDRARGEHPGAFWPITPPREPASTAAHKARNVSTPRRD